MFRAYPTKHYYHAQRGIALATSLLIMVVLTILGISVMNMTTLEEKMAFNTQDRYMARHFAESSILLLAKDANLPNPADPGVSANIFTNLENNIPGLKAGSGRVTYMQSAPINNLPGVNPKATYLSSGSTVSPSGASTNSGLPIFQISTASSTAAGTTAEMKGGYYFISAPMLMN